MAVVHTYMGFAGGAVVKNLPANTGDARDVASIPGSGISPGVGNGNPLQYSCLENSTSTNGLQSMGCKESDTTGVTECVRMCTHTHTPL